MIAQELEVCLHTAFVEARQMRHEFIAVEHLLLALLDCPTSAEVLRACSANMDELRTSLTQHIAAQTPRVAADRDVDTQPTLGFQRVIQRAILQVQSSGKKEVTGADALGAIFGEKDSHAVRLLMQHGVSGPEDFDNQALHDTAAEPGSDGSAIAQELEASLGKAFADARKHRHEFVTAEHLLFALLDNRSATKVLRGCSVRMQSLRRELAQRIAGHALPVPADRKLGPQPSLGFQRVIQDATGYGQRMDREVTGSDALVAILNDKDSPAAQVLAQHGLTRFDAVFYLTHGVAPNAAWDKADIPEGAELQVVLYNDDYTPMQFVVDVLEKFFSMPRSDATDVMLDVHRKGIGVCGRYPRNEAAELVETVLEYARQHGHPLNCTVVAPE